MKRPIPSFTVEVRRRPGRPAPASAKLSAPEVKPRVEFDRDTDRAIAALFAPKTNEHERFAPHPLDAGTENVLVAAELDQPRGRVLDSLVIERPLSDIFDAEPAPDEAPNDDVAMSVRRPRAKTRKPAAKATASSSERPMSTDEKDAAPPARRLRATQSASKAARVKAVAHKASPSVAPATAKSDFAAVGKTSLVAPPPAAGGDDTSAEPRKRNIMGRYVYRDEPKPGQRWKHKLRRKW